MTERTRRILGPVEDPALERVRERFWAKVKRNGNGCWPWQGFCKPSGHGLTSHQSLQIHASRKAWVLTHGAVPEDLCVLHKCDNPACCNPAHMYLGTRIDNLIDTLTKPRSSEREARGRPTVLTDAQVALLYKRRTEDLWTLQRCAREFGVHISTVMRYVTNRRKQIIAKRQADRRRGVLV